MWFVKSNLGMMSKACQREGYNGLLGHDTRSHFATMRANLILDNILRNKYRAVRMWWALLVTNTAIWKVVSIRMTSQDWSSGFK